jgi:miniconductance mechanosensitive channel
MVNTFVRTLVSFGIEPSLSVPLATLIAFLIVLAAIGFTETVVKKVMLRLISRFAEKTTTRLDDLLVNHKVFDRIARLVPPLLAYRFVKSVLVYYPEAINPVRDGLVIIFAILLLLLLLSALDALHDFFSTHRVGMRLPVKSFIQVFKTIVITLGLIFVVSRLLGKSPVVFFSGIGAFTAVLLLVFKDSILGFVAGIQLSSNDLVRIGDWIAMPKYDANGVVTDISLVTVSIQNFDKSIVVLPAYTLISEGFRNWRGMEEASGRRIKRFVSIDMTSIRFLDDEAMERLRKVHLLKPYLEERAQEVEEHNRVFGFEGDSPVNGRRLTNIGTFRAYLEAYIRHLPAINSDMSAMVRYLQPEGMGLPMEFYCFSKEKDSKSYETVQADIIDHILAVIPYFGLRVFQLQGHESPSLPAE